MEARKKFNFKTIYSKIAKYGVLISDLAEEYGVSRADFIERLEMGLDPKLFSKVIKEDERNQRRSIKTRREAEMSTTIVTRQKEEKTSTTQEVADTIEENDTEAKEEPKMEKVTIASLEAQKEDIMLQEQKNRKGLEEALQILDIRQESFDQAQSVVRKAARALEKARCQVEQAKKVVEMHQGLDEKLSVQLGDIEEKILEAKNRAIYLVAPGYSGPKPEYGKFLSTSEVSGFEVSICNAEADFAIEPEFKDMVLAGYDSIKEYTQGLWFVALCVEYAYKELPHTILVDDERLKKLLEIHLNAFIG